MCYNVMRKSCQFRHLFTYLYKDLKEVMYMLPIDKKHIKYNFSTSTETNKFIVIHDTGNKARGADDISHYKYFNGAVRNASAHYFVDKDSITETVDPNLTSWHCGDGNGRNGISNKNSIGIEICVNADGDYSLAVKNTIELTKYLMARYNIPASNVKRHLDASGKNCPASMSADNWSLWNWFKAQLTSPVSATQPSKVTPVVKATSPIGSVKELQQLLNALGYVGSNGKALTVDGVEGANSTFAIRAFQSDKKLSVDGCAGNNTWTTLRSAIANKNAVEAVKASVKYATVTVDTLNVRNVDNSSSTKSIIGTLIKGQKVKLDFKKGDWWSVYFGDHGGFIHGDFIKLI